MIQGGGPFVDASFLFRVGLPEFRLQAAPGADIPEDDQVQHPAAYGDHRAQTFHPQIVALGGLKEILGKKAVSAASDCFQVGDDAGQGFGLDEPGGVLSDHLPGRRHFHEPKGGVVGEEDRAVPVHDQGGVKHVFHHRPEYFLFLGGN